MTSGRLVSAVSSRLSAKKARGLLEVRANNTVVRISNYSNFASLRTPNSSQTARNANWKRLNTSMSEHASNSFLIVKF